MFDIDWQSVLGQLAYDPKNPMIFSTGVFLLLFLGFTLIYNLLGIGFASGGAITHARLTAAEEREEALAHFRRLSAELLRQCDGELIIPMSGAAESLNAGVAAAIVMWEMCRGEA